MRNLAVALSCTMWLLACSGGESAETPAPEPAPAPAPAPEPAKGPADLQLWTLPEGANPALTDPSKATKQAPDVFKVKYETTKGDFVVEYHRDWSPNGADRAYNLVDIGYYKDIAFFRAIEGFMVQFGISGYPEVNAKWRDAGIPDDEVKQSNTKGMVTFAHAGPGTRTTQIFINYKDNSMLDSQGFSPVGKVVEGMEVVDSLHKGYGEGAPRGRGPDQMKLQTAGNAYLEKSFPELDYIKSATLLE
jgi:peptidyl-prolyl cis-trans isomerase A (cyclophilin A)